LYSKPRIFNDLLSSQPLCFNLFGELCSDLPLASALVNSLTEGRFLDVQDIKFEHSPGRRDPRYTGDRSAFDVYLECRTRGGGRGFLGIEVKYHENLIAADEGENERYREIAGMMACFVPDAAEVMTKAPLQQIRRDHLLLGITKIVDGYDDALFVMLYPRENPHCSSAVEAYRRCLSDKSSFASWTLEDVVACLRQHSRAEWISLVADRYLGFAKVDRRLAAN
jgi:hypothetical protein